jgi:AcrR family transcriptional regulator
MTEVEHTTAAADGRRARRERNSDRVVEALLELINEGVVWPSAQEVADRAEVSLRSVFRYFDDLDDLLELAMDRQLERTKALFEPPARAETLQGRIDKMVAARLDMYDALGNLARALRTRGAVHPKVAEAYAKRRVRLRGTIQSYLVEDLAALGPDEPVVVEGLLLLLSFEGLDMLADIQGLSRSQAADVLRHAMRRMLDPALCCATPLSAPLPERPAEPTT